MRNRTSNKRRKIAIEQHQRAHWKSQKRTGDALPKRIAQVIETGKALVTEAKGLGRARRTSARVAITVGAPLKVLLDGSEKHGLLILVSTDKRPRTPDGFRASWAKAMKKAGISGVTFNDLRGTAATRLQERGCTEAEIATITGHSLRDVRSILDAHYLHRDPALAESAIRKLERGTRFSN